MLVIPTILEGCNKDEIPNVKFCASKIIAKNKEYIDPNVFNSQIKPALLEMEKHEDQDVRDFAKLAL